MKRSDWLKRVSSLPHWSDKVPRDIVLLLIVCNRFLALTDAAWLRVFFFFFSFLTTQKGDELLQCQVLHCVTSIFLGDGWKSCVFTQNDELSVMEWRREAFKASFSVIKSVFLETPFEARV